MNEIKTGHIEHTSANNADELYKEIISHDGSINRVRAFEIAYDTFGLDKNNIYIVNQKVDKYFIEKLQNAGEVDKCPFYDISKNKFRKLISKYYADGSKSTSIFSYFGSYDRIYNRFMNEKKYLLYEKNLRDNTVQVGVIYDEGNVYVDIENKKMMIWIYFFTQYSKAFNQYEYVYYEIDFNERKIKLKKYMSGFNGELELFSEHNDYRFDEARQNIYDWCEKIYFAYQSKCNEIKKIEFENNVSAEYIYKLDWRSFEKHIAELFSENQFDVELTSATNDEGRDVIACKNGKKYFIECKHFKEKNSVGREVIQKLIGAAEIENIYKCICVTTGSFTKTATNYANIINKKRGYKYVELWGINEVINLGREISNKNINKVEFTNNYCWPPQNDCIRNFVELLFLKFSHVENNYYKRGQTIEKTRKGYICPKCGKGKLLLRKGTYGLFWGCSRYPNCKATYKNNKGKPKMKNNDFFC